MEVIRIYNPNNEGVGLTKVRKNLVPDTVVTHEENIVKPDLWCSVIANGEVFIIDENYDDFTERLKNAKLISSDGGVHF
ncbi:hypothetical protein LCGC14_1767480 [marine sediment metagenome]|uniref:Uncharacterized protein n=1 Tax=marine sediment metagenome TaxID=412755 RepID=A0A0F9JE24_9ZZZZ